MTCHTKTLQHEIWAHAVWKTYVLLVQGDLFGEALLGKVAHGIVVSIRQEMSQVVLRLGILLQVTARLVCDTTVECRSTDWRFLVAFANMFHDQGMLLVWVSTVSLSLGMYKMHVER